MGLRCPLGHADCRGFRHGSAVKHHARQLWISVLVNLRAASESCDRKENREAEGEMRLVHGCLADHRTSTRPAPATAAEMVRLEDRFTTRTSSPNAPSSRARPAAVRSKPLWL